MIISKLNIEIVKHLHNATDYLSGEQLSEKLGVSRSAIWKQIEILRKEGYVIEAVPRLGYKLLVAPDVLSTGEIKACLTTNLLGNNVVVKSKTSSTNDVAKQLANEQKTEGLVIVAEEQTKGKGRRGRNWFSEPGGLYFSLILKPKIKLQEASKLTLLAAIGVVEVLQQEFNLNAQIKWPNDIMVNNKKICGILTELSADTETVHYVIIGIGLNVNQLPTKWTLDLQEIATSLRLETGEQIDRKIPLKKILEKLEQLYLALGETSFDTFIDKARELTYVLGKNIEVQTNNEKYEARALDISEDGALIVKRKNGGIEQLWAADVSIRP